MEFTGQIVEAYKAFPSGEYRITFSVNERDAVEACSELQNILLQVKAVKYRKKRSVDANALLWKCLTEMAAKLNCDKWEVYLQELKHFGKCVPLTIQKDALEVFKQTWREIEIVGEFEAYGQKMVSLICYFGSHLYNTEEFSRLLNGVIQDMKDMGLQPPPSEDMRRSLEEWERIQQSARCNR